MHMHLEEIKKFLLNSRTEVACQMGDVQCFLYNENEVFYVTMNGKISASSNLEQLDIRTIAAIHKALLS